MIKLLIEDKIADIEGNEKVIAEYAIAPIGDISKRVGARSIQFKLPKTANNRNIFESSEQLSSKSVKPYRRLKARVFVDGVDMQMLFCTLEKVNDFYNVRLYGLNSDLFADLKGKNLSELDLRKYNHHWTTKNIVDSLTNTSGYIYSIIDFSEDSPNTYFPATGNTIKSQVLQPSFFNRTVLQEIITQSGYQLVDSIDYLGKEEISVLGCESFERDKDGRKYDATFQISPLQTTYRSFLDLSLALQPTEWGDGLYFSVISENEPYYGNTLFAPTISFQDDILINIEGSLSLKSNGSTTPFTIQAVYTDDSFAVPQTRTLITGTATGAYQTFTFAEQLEVSENPTFQNINLGIYIITNGEIIEFDYLQSSFQIKDTNVTRNRPIIFEGKSDYVTIANNIFEGTQADFLSDYLKLHNALLYTDKFQNIVYLTPFSDVLKNISAPAIWTGKVDYTNTYEVEFTLDNYAQINNFKYEDDDTVIKPIGTDSFLAIDDENLPLEKDFLALRYAASVDTLRLDDRKVIQLRMYEGGIRKTDLTPRILYLKRVSDSLNFVDINVNLNRSFTGLVPYSYFIDSEESINLGFGNSILELYYNTLLGILDRAKIATIRIRLTASDIATFDYLRPVYIEELGAYFYVSKIRYTYTSNESAECELVKLL